MPYRWPDDAVFTDLELNVQEPWCQMCGGRLTVCDHRHRRLFTLHGPVHVVCKLVHCPHQVCPAHTRTISPEAETAVSEILTAPMTPIDDNPHSIPVYGTDNPRQKEYPET